MNTQLCSKYNTPDSEWLDTIPPHWQVRRLKYVSSINDNVLPDSTDPDKEILYVDISGVDQIHGITNKEPLVFSEAPSRARRLVKHGDVIVSTVRTYLRAITPIVNPDGNLVVSTGFAVVRPTTGLSSRFAAYGLKAPYFVERVVANSEGVSYPAINASKLATFELALPPVVEQEMIADFLDREIARIDELISKRLIQIELLQEKRIALITKAVTVGIEPFVTMTNSGINWLGEIPAHWEAKKIKYVLTIRGGLVDPGRAEFRAMVLIAPNHIEGKTGRVLALETADEQEAASGKYLFKQGDILYSKIRPALAKACLAPEDGLCSADMYAMVPRESNDAKYLLYLLLSDAFTKLAIDESLRVAMPKINQEDLGEIKLPIPAVGEQRKIVEYIEAQIGAIDELILKVKEGMEKSLEYRTALISAAVTGQIDVHREVEAAS